jgi:hypothetical protein
VNVPQRWLSLLFVLLFPVTLSAVAQAETPTDTQPATATAPAAPAERQPVAGQPEAKPATAKPKQVLQFAGVQSPVAITTTAAAFQQVLYLESTEDVATTGAFLTVRPFSGAADVDITCKVDNDNTADCAQPFDVKGLAGRKIALTATLPKPGKYTTVVSLVNAGVKVPLTISVELQKHTMGIDILTVERAAASSDAFPLRLTVQEKLGHAETLQKPVLLNFSRKLTGGALTQAFYDRIETFEGDAKKGASEMPATWTLDAYGVKPVTMRIHGLRDAGEYQATVAIGAAGSLPKTQVIALTARHRGRNAAWIIFFGALLSFGIRMLVKQRRPRLVQQRGALALLDDLDALPAQWKELSETEQEVLRRLRERVHRLATRLSDESVPDADALLDEVNRKLSLFPDWINLRRGIDAASPAVGAPFRAVLDAARTVMEQSGSTKEETTAESEALRKAIAELAKAENEALAKQFEALEQALAGLSDAAGSPEASAKKEGMTAAANARQYLKAGKRGEAAAELERGWAALTVKLLTSFREKVANAPKPATFPDLASWTAFKDPIRQKLDAALKQQDPAQQMAAYREALALWIAGLAETAATYLTQEVQIIKSTGALDDARKAEHTATAARIAAVLQQAAVDARAGKLSEAQTAFDAAMQDFAAMKKTLNGLGVPMSSSADPLPSAVGVSPGEALGGGTIVSVDERRERRLPTRRFLRFSTIGIDVFVLGVALIVAVLLGLQLLWQNNPIWGSSNDYIVAFIWGLGLHQISGTAFEGVTGLAEKLQK